VAVSALVANRVATSGIGKPPAEYDWLERTMIATGEKGKAAVEAARGNIAKTEIATSITVGGQDTLEGADYFWFWTYTILVTAVLFVPVGYIYKEKSYIQTEREGDVQEGAPAKGE